MAVGREDSGCRASSGYYSGAWVELAGKVGGIGPGEWALHSDG